MGAISIFIPILLTVAAILIAIFALPFFITFSIPILSIVGVSWLIYYLDYAISTFIDRLTSGEPGTIVLVLLIIILTAVFIRNKKKITKWYNKK